MRTMVVSISKVSKNKPEDIKGLAQGHLADTPGTLVLFSALPLQDPGGLAIPKELPRGVHGSVFAVMTQKPANGGLLPLAYIWPLASWYPALDSANQMPTTSFSLPIGFPGMG